MLSITDANVIKYYQDNPHLDINTMNVIFIEVMKNLTKNVTNNLDSSQNSHMIKQLTEKFNTFTQQIESNYSNQAKTIHEIQIKLTDVSKELYNTISVMIRSQLDTIQNSLRETIKSNNGDSEKNILQFFTHHNELFTKKIEGIMNHTDLRENLSSEIGKVNHYINEETTRIIKSFENNDTGQIILKINELVSNKYTELDTSIKSRLETYLSTDNNGYTQLLSKLEPLSSSATIVSDYFLKQSGSNTKGKAGEAQFEIVLSDAFPSASIVNTAGQTACGDFIIEREEKTNILIDTKDYNTVIPVKEVEKMIRDIEVNKCNGILVSQYSGIAQKENFEINIHNNNIIIFIHNCNYNKETINTAVNIIDHLEPIITNTDSQSESIPAETLLDFNREYQILVSQKNNFMAMMKKQRKEADAEFNKIDLPKMTEFLNSKFANTGKTGFKCDICNDWSGKNKMSLAAHQRKCKKDV
jgi:hypothetical protein